MDTQQLKSDHQYFLIELFHCGSYNENHSLSCSMHSLRNHQASFQFHQILYSSIHTCPKFGILQLHSMQLTLHLLKQGMEIFNITSHFLLWHGANRLLKYDHQVTKYSNGELIIHEVLKNKSVCQHMQAVIHSSYTVCPRSGNACLLPATLKKLTPASLSSPTICHWQDT